MQTEVKIGKGMRVDAIDFARKVIYELKPWTESGRKRGAAQIAKYVKHMRKKMKDSNLTGQLIFY
jgi:hypothetical protein